jgi:hypothetical protein
MISFGPVVDDGVSSRGEREEICFFKRVIFEFREVFVSRPLRSACASLNPKEPPQWGLRYSLLACHAPGFVPLPPMSQPLGLRCIWVLNQLCQPSAMVADRNVSTAFSACHLTVTVLALLETLGSFVNRAEHVPFSACSIGIWR